MEELQDKRVIVIGKNYSTSLGVIRAIGQAGYSSTVVLESEYHKKSLRPELHSKYVLNYCYANDENEILRELNKLKDEKIKQLIIPADDYCASTLDHNYDDLSNLYYLPSVDCKAGLLTEMMDKDKQKTYVRACGLHCAKSTVIIVDNRGSFDIPIEVQYPCYTKPLLSVGSPKSYIKKCSSENDLRKLLQIVAKKGSNRILVEEYIDIESEFVVPGVALSQETVIIPAIIKKVKIGSGEHKGVTMKGVIVEENEDIKNLRDALCKLIQSIKLYGLFDIEVIFSKGKYYFNELNLRYGAAGYGVTAAGVNLPGIYAQYILEGKIPEKLDICSGMTFTSEKVALDSFRAGFSDWKEYKKDVNDAEVRFIKSDDDPNPYKIYRRIERRARVRRFLNRITGRR